MEKELGEADIDGIKKYLKGVQENTAKLAIVLKKLQGMQPADTVYRRDIIISITLVDTFFGRTRSRRCPASSRPPTKRHDVLFSS